MKDFDLIVLGGGSAGYAAACTATQLGLRVAVVEGGAEVGGLCILRGCMPSKALIESANRSLAIRGAGVFGLEVDPPTVLPDAIHARKARHVAEFADYRAKQLESGRFAFFRGWAGFIDPHTIEIRAQDGTARRLTAETFLLATGSRPRPVEIPGLAEAGFLDSDAVLSQAHLPRSVAILGGGPTAVEFAHYYSGLGAQVTLIQRSEQLLKEMDGDIARTLGEAFRKRGLRVYCHTELKRIQPGPNGGKEIIFCHNGKTRGIEAEEIVCALGRIPQLEGLDLANAGLETTRGYLSVNAAQQTSVPHIFAAGDVAGPYEVVHIAIQQGELAARNAARMVKEAADKGNRPMEEIDYRLRLFAVFTEPEIAAVGVTEQELQGEGVPYRVASYPFGDHGKAILMEETSGFVKLLASEETGEIVGGAVIGPRASELIQEIVVAMRFHATARQLMEIPHYHPTLSEIWTYPAEELAEGM
ncbi:MAG: NAD(P)/FAD-dependent oxidoreductase [Chthoniobacteraceae bacterium]|nr:NAD(P)/FAD-dependent oxidoreductase [Chthoniobacteraceae bacterium]